MATPMRWRPLAAFDLDHARTLVEQSISAWRDDWFGSRGSDAVRVESVRLVSADSPHELARAAQVSALWWTPARHAPRVLAALALDVSAATAMQDCAPLIALGERVVDELVRAMASVSEDPSSSPPSHDGVLVRFITSHDTEIGSIFCPASLICERYVPQANAMKTRSTPSSRRQALASTEVSLHAHLGRAALTLDQLFNLAPGDVLTLGKKLDEPIELTVPIRHTSASKPIASGRLGHTSGKLSIQLNTFAVQENA